jgi:glycosyltransferase involved in cell wall biosynthesis
MEQTVAGARVMTAGGKALASRTVKVDFITTQSLDNPSGGWSGASFNLRQQLERHPALSLNYVGPFNPPVSKSARLVSKAKRLLGGKGSFYYFSEPRLAAIRRQVAPALKEADYNLFFGITPWVKCEFETPYGVYLDACFRTYFNNNLRTEEFSSADIGRIEQAEKSWLERANHIFWASAWARDEAIGHYHLSTDNHHVVGMGGNIEVPAADTYSGALAFLFIAQNFALKGGPVACAALERVRQRHPDAKLVIVGQKPPDEFLRQPGVEYCGYLRKGRREELARFGSILASAFCLLHPTNSDTVSQVIIECGYFGCPSIAPRRFAIPELVIDRQTGVLIDSPFTAADFEREMLWMLADRPLYERMRRDTRAHFTSDWTFKAVADRIRSCILP